MTPEFRCQVNTTDPREMLRSHLDFIPERDPLTRRMHLDIKSYLPGDILTKVDRTSMMTSLEVRVPILDHKLVEFAATIPSALKIGGTTTKVILKKVAERLMPREMVHRPKRGFTLPVAVWLRDSWSGMAHELLLGGRAMGRGNLNPKYVQRIFTEHIKGKRDNSGMIWTLMMLELWHREKIDRPPVA
jgi:asparagine synthase (glutamine-hydrolysing)